MSDSNPSPIVTEVLRFEDLPLGSPGTRRAITRSYSYQLKAAG